MYEKLSQVQQTIKKNEKEPQKLRIIRTQQVPTEKDYEIEDFELESRRAEYMSEIFQDLYY